MPSLSAAFQPPAYHFHDTPLSESRSPIVGNDCVVGHVAHLEGCRLEDFSQVSSGAIALHNAVIGRGSIVAANSVVLNNMIVPPGALAVGAPAVIKEGRARMADIELAVNAYVAKVARFKKDLRRID